MSQLMSFLITGLLHDLHFFTWLTDNDDFVSNEDFKKLLNLLLLVTCKSKTNIFPQVMMTTTSDKSLFKSKIITEDLLGIPDLIAGTLAKVLTDSGQFLFEQEIEGPNQMFALEESHKSEFIFDWFTKESKYLKKFLIIKHPHFDSDPGNPAESGIKILFPYPKNAHCKVKYSK